MTQAPYMVYAGDVLAGRISAPRTVHQAVQRFLDDLNAGVWQFHPEHVERVAKFCELLPVTEGPLAGTKTKLMNWQWFAIANMYGFTDRYGARRYRIATIFVPKGNAKSSSAAMLGLYHLCADGEAVPQCYSVAVMQEQAKIVWYAASRQVRASPALQSHYDLTMTDNNASCKIKRPDGSVFIPLSSEKKGIQGKNVAFCAIDEIASHPTADVYDAMTTSNSKRKHPMILNISTASGNNDGIGRFLWDLGVKVLNKEVEAERHFFLIYGLDDGDDPYDPSVWRKVNPSWGITVMPDSIEMTMEAAKTSTAREAAAFTFHLNKWIAADNALFSVQTLQKCADPTLKLDDFAGMECEIGCDLAYKLDMCSVVITFPKFIESKLHYYTFTKCYLNEEAVKTGWNQRYPQWVKDGLIDVTPGNTTDFDRIIRDIVGLCKKFRVRNICIDRFQAGGVIHLLMKENLPVIEFPMTTVNLSAPTREFEAAYTDGRFHYDGNPVLEWNCGCVVGHYDAMNNVFPKKNPKRQTDKIDIFMGLVMSLARAMGDQDAGLSIYETRSMLVLG